MPARVALPLRWPDDWTERLDYERQLVEYARLMAPLVTAAEGDDRRTLVNTLLPFVAELEFLWADGVTPQAIKSLVAAVRAVAV